MEYGFTTAAYVVAAVLFIQSLGGLSGQESAKRAVWYGIVGMALAVAATLYGPGAGNWLISLVMVAVGGVIGWYVAQRVQMTEMPQLVAAMHSLVGLAAVFIGFNTHIELTAVAGMDDTARAALTGFAQKVAEKTGVEIAILRVETFLGVFIGAVTFSGSVAAFARFTLMLVYAIQGQFSKVRSFVFIDGIDEVTDYFRGEEDIANAIHRVNTEADVVWVDGHSDYGHAFEVFWERYGKDVGPKTTVLLLGDARNNYHASQSWVIKEIRQKARHVYWLNPEPKSYWNTGDSIVGDYGTHTDGVYECRNLRQLEAFVEKLA